MPRPRPRTPTAVSAPQAAPSASHPPADARALGARLEAAHARTPSAGYGAAALLVSLALAASLALAPWIAPNFHMVFVAAVFVAAWYGGTGPALASAAGGLLAMHLFLVGPPGLASIVRPDTIGRSLAFLALAGAAALLSAEVRRSHVRLLDAAREASLYSEQLQEQAVELEQQTEEAQSLAEELEDQVEEAARLQGELEEALAAEREASEALRGEEEWLRFLAHAGETLGSSLEYEETLRRVCRLAVPLLADYCVVDLLDDGVLRRVEAVHAEPERREAMERLKRNPIPLDHPTHPSVVAVRTGEARLVEEAAGAFANPEVAPEHARLVRELQPRSAIAVPMRAGSGEVLGAVTLVASGSERRYGARDLRRARELGARAAYAIENARLYARTAEANRAKADFLAVMSHELRTPLNAILGYTDLFLAGVPEPLPARATPNMERVHGAARHLRSLIEEVLSFARLEAGHEQAGREATDLVEVVRAAVSFCEPLARERGLDFRADLPDALVAHTDARKARQIVVNLAANAVKFTERGEVSVSAAAENGDAVVRVRDTGPGIAPEHLERIFEPFWQADQRLARAHGGSGLGLSVARRLARLLGGELEVESRPGEGTEFVLRLPLGAAAE
jgi:signal transduction histidine kinase